jgi:hypothetical protein
MTHIRFLFAGVAVLLLTSPKLHSQSCGVSSVTPEWINVKADCGAKGDGTTDDTAAFQSAFDRLDFRKPGGSGNGGTVYCPNGLYKITQPINITGVAVRFVGNSGPTYNDGASVGKGCTLLYVPSSGTGPMLNLDPGAGKLFHNGPVLEYINLRDGTANYSNPNHINPGTSELIRIAGYNNWTLRNLATNGANVAVEIYGGAGDSPDASWGYISQLVCNGTNTCVSQTGGLGGFVMVGGHISAYETGVNLQGNQGRILGVKFDCGQPPLPGTTSAVGVNIVGRNEIVEASDFEYCDVGVQIEVDKANQPVGGGFYSGRFNRVVDNYFNTNTVSGLSYQAGPDGQPGPLGVVVGTPMNGCGATCPTEPSETQVIGNTYGFYPAGSQVLDFSATTTHFDQGSPSVLGGAGAPANTACVPGTMYLNTQTTRPVPGTLYVCTVSRTGPPSAGIWQRVY